MKSLEEKRNELSFKFTNDVQGVSQSVLSPKGCYEAGWDACAKEYQTQLQYEKDALEAMKEHYERQLEIAKEALEFYGERNNWKCFDSHSEVKDVITVSDISAKNHITDSHYMIASGGNRARAALKEIKSAGE